MKKKSFGINIQLKHKNQEQLDKYISLLKELNVGWVRLGFDFYSYSKGKLDFNSCDYLIKNLRNKEIKILGSLQGFVPGTLVNLFSPGLNGFFNPLDNFELYSQFVSDICHRYKKQISHWQVWVEPNFKRMWINKPSPSEYVLLVKKIRPIIKGINKNNKIVMGAINGITLLRDDFQKHFGNLKEHGIDNFIDNIISSLINNVAYDFQEYFKDLIKNGINNFIDIYSFNPYFSGNYISFNNSKNYQIERLKWIINNFLKIYKKNKLKKPIWISEIGIFDRWVNLTSKQMGEIYIEMFNFAVKNNIKKVFIWNFMDFVDDCYSRWNPERFPGIVKNNLEPKESFRVLKKFLNSGRV